MAPLSESPRATSSLTRLPGIPNTSVGRNMHLAGEAVVVGLQVGAEVAADAEEPGAELAVTLDVLFLQTWTSGGETVSPGEDREFFSEGSRGPGEPFGCVVRARVAHEAYLEVQRREGDSEGRDASGEPEPPADVVGHARSQGIVGDEEHAALDLRARDGLGNVVQEAGDK